MNSSSVARVRTLPCEGNQYSHGFWMSCRGDRGKEDPTVHVYFFVDLCLSVMATNNTRNRGFNHSTPPYSKDKGAV